MANSADATSNKCFSGILRRLLCSGSLPTHPSDQLIESNIKESGEQMSEKSLKHETNVKEAAATSTPGVVARLMGLDSFPSTPLAPKDRTLGSFFRSRSVNSIDFLSHFDPIKQRHNHHQHRRVRTSVSFREGINDDYTSAILRLEGVYETAECEQELLIRRRPEKEMGERSRNSEKLQEERVGNKPSKKVEMDETRSSACPKLSSGVGSGTSHKMEFRGRTRQSLKERRQIVKPVNSKEEEVRGSKCLKKKRNKILCQKVRSGCSLKKVHPEGTVPGVRSRNNLQSQIGNSESPYSSGAHSQNREVRAIIKGKNERKMKSKESCYYKRMAEEICRVADEDVKENWTNRVVLKFEDLEEICQRFGQEILGVLLKQFVDELVLLHQTRNTY